MSNAITRHPADIRRRLHREEQLHRRIHALGFESRGETHVVIPLAAAEALVGLAESFVKMSAAQSGDWADVVEAGKAIPAFKATLYPSAEEQIADIRAGGDGLCGRPAMRLASDAEDAEPFDGLG